MNGTIFIAGAYGAGKSTLCSKLTDKFGIPFFSAGDLISDQNGERYGANKAVDDKDNNQVILARRVQELTERHSKFLLAGHFCIFNTKHQVELLPESVFPKLNIMQIILLETSSRQIAEHLRFRDSKGYSQSAIDELILKERVQAIKISKELNCSLTVYQMTFSDVDVENIGKFIRGG